MKLRRLGRFDAVLITPSDASDQRLFRITRVQLDATRRTETSFNTAPLSTEYLLNAAMPGIEALVQPRNANRSHV
jgi:hypothetical protein